MQWTNPILQLGAISVSIIMGLCLIIVRIRAGNQPTTLKKLLFHHWVWLLVLLCLHFL